MLARLTMLLPGLQILPRFKVLLGVLGALVAHVIEIWIFAIAYLLLIKSNQFGYLTGELQHGLLDYVYYSFVTYTSLGLGDIVPHGDIRYLSGLEALIGLLLIAWSASFLYMEMQKYWKQ